jgi:hypothetical protein
MANAKPAGLPRFRDCPTKVPEGRARRGGIALTAESETQRLLSAIERYMEAGDGLPVVPPTSALVAEMAAASGLAPETELGRMPPSLKAVTVRDVAINAVLAGCKPDYMPVLIAAARGLCHRDFDLFGVATSTKGAAPLLIVNGPIRHTIGLNCRGAVFGPGFRANATIGRAVRLLILNVATSRPHVLDKATMAHSGRFSFCIGEDEEDSVWAPLHVERGLSPDQSAVTLWGGEAPRQVSIGDNSGEAILIAVCFTLASIGVRPVASARPEEQEHELDPNGTPHVLVFAKEHRDILIREGWTKAKIREFVCENTYVPDEIYRRMGRNPAEMRSVVGSPDDILVVAAGGDAGRFASVLPGWTRQSRPVTVPIE